MPGPSYVGFTPINSIFLSAPCVTMALWLCKKPSLFSETITKVFSGKITCFIYFAKEMPQCLGCRLKFFSKAEC